MVQNVVYIERGLNMKRSVIRIFFLIPKFKFQYAQATEGSVPTASVIHPQVSKDEFELNTAVGFPKIVKVPSRLWTDAEGIPPVMTQFASVLTLMPSAEPNSCAPL